MFLRSGKTLQEEHKTKSLLELLHDLRFVLKLLYTIIVVFKTKGKH